MKAAAPNVTLRRCISVSYSQLHARAIWNYALTEGKAHGTDANFDGFETADFYMNAPAPTGPMLRRKFAILTSSVMETQHSEDGTVKLLVR